LELGSPVAIKVLSPAATMDDAVQDRFRFEAQVLAGLRHPNIVNVFDLGEGDEGVRYIAMELLQGETLARLLERQNRLECGAAVRIVCQVAEALDTLHQRGLIHRDVKPANVFVVRDDVGQEYVKLMDFGLVRAQTKTSTAAPDAGSAADHDVPRRRQNTQRGTILGSGAYMSPELILGERLDARSDIYALGVMAYRMLTGALPFNAADLRELIAQHVSEPVEPLRKRAPDARIPDALEGVILRALAKTAGERQATAREFARELRSAWFEEPTAPSATHGSVGAPRVDRAPSIGAGRGVTLRFGTPSLEMPGSQSVRIAHRQSDVENPGYRGASRAISVPASMLADDSMGGISVGATSAPNSGIVPLVSPARSSGSGSRRLAVAWSAAMTSLVLAGGLAVYALVGLGSPGRSGAAETAPNLVASGLPSGPPVPQAPAARSSHVVNTIGGPESGRARPVASVVTASRFAAPKPISEDGPRDAGAIRSRAPRSESSSERIPSPRRKPAEANDPKAPSERPAIGSDDELKAPVWR
jgi:serine/threonine protein kinase